MRINNRAWGWWIAAIAIAWPTTAAMAPQAPVPGERLSDKEVKVIIEDIDQARDRFEDQLDGNLKSSILRTQSGELSVERYLDDLQENVKRLKDRFSDDYAASTEAETVLKQGSQIHGFIKSKPAELKGGSEWDAMARELVKLASAYRTTFPLPKDAVVRRMNDRETAAAAEEVAKGADQLRRQLDQEQALPKPGVDTAKQDLNTLADQAREVKSRAEDSKPATAEARQLFDLARKVSTFMKAQGTLLPGTTGAWTALASPLSRLGQAYGLTAMVPGK